MHTLVPAGVSHLNVGIPYFRVTPSWAMGPLPSPDVFSLGNISLKGWGVRGREEMAMLGRSQVIGPVGVGEQPLETGKQGVGSSSARA